MRCQVCLFVLDGTKGPAYAVFDGFYVHSRRCAKFLESADIQKVLHSQRTLEGRPMNSDEFMAMVRRARKEAMA